jgi:hypothetical protein
MLHDPGEVWLPPAIASRLYQEFKRADRCALLVLEGLACEVAGWSARDLSAERVGPLWFYRARDLLCCTIAFASLSS